MDAAKLRIAVVDDEPSVGRAMQRLLHAAGMDVAVFDSGNAFLESMEGRTPDCVVLDLHMPGVSGFDVQDAMAKSKPDVPLVVVTGHDSPEARSRARRAGAAAYLLKPVDDDELICTIASVTSHARR